MPLLPARRAVANWSWSATLWENLTKLRPAMPQGNMENQLINGSCSVAWRLLTVDNGTRTLCGIRCSGGGRISGLLHEDAQGAEGSWDALCLWEEAGHRLIALFNLES